ncbi:hypothetical protein [Microbacterium testaceum]|uniref:hypothetical protein n=1 Tax=Microbacterium testaceum TaxID=2033 RepID=UPI0012488D72|nr:hypothetical protein [Microbacterium testaceum]
MRTSSLLTPLAVAALTVGAVVAAPLAASAATPAPSASAHAPASLSDVQARATAAAGKQIDALTAQITRLTANTGLTDDDRTKALAILNDDLDGIHALQSDIAAATTVKKVRTEVRTAATTYAVRKLALPETRWAARVDDVTARALPRLQAEQQKLSAALAAHPDKSTSALTDALSDLSTQISTAQTDANGLSASALALSPATVAGDAGSLSHVRDQVKALDTAVHTANQDAKTVRTGVK